MSLTLKRQKATIERNENGQYVVKSARHKGLVLSGGGAKGISYIGMINALNDRGYLKQLTHVSGSSAGAMTASIIAVGMSPEEITEIVDNLDIKNLTNEPRSIFRASGNNFRNLIDLFYFIQIKKYLQELERPIPEAQEKNFVQLCYKISLYEQVLSEQGLKINKLNDVIQLGNSANGLVKLNAAFVNFPKLNPPAGKEVETPYLTFGDLKALRELLPQDKKYLIKNLSVAVTNQTKHKSERYSEDRTPNQAIAQVVQWSGAHPALFVPGINATGEQVADGGILDNMPEIENLDREEVLCVKALSAGEYYARVQKAEKITQEMLSAIEHFLDPVVNFALGGEWLKATVALLNREKVFHYLENMIYINTGEIAVTTIAPTKKQREQAIQNGYQQTLATLDKHNKTFSHPLIAFLYVWLEQLEQTRVISTSDPVLFQAAKAITLLQNQMILEVQDGKFNSIKTYTQEIEELVAKVELEEGEKEKVLALCYKQVNFLTGGKYLEYLAQTAAEEKAAQHLHWATRVLIFILQPIKWVLSLLKSSSLFASTSEIAKAEEVEVQEASRGLTP
jgi:VPS inhibitor protein D